MKKLIFVALFLFYNLAFGADKLYQKALEFEANGDKENALKYYKLSAQKSLNLDAKQPPQTTTLKSDELFWGISAYHLNYFMPLSYSSPNSLKKSISSQFQISLKKLIFDDLLGFDERYYFAYTQISWWDLYSDSAPFYETNYQPELFVEIPLNYPNLANLKFGFLHDSNGKDDELSRSWNRVYVAVDFKLDNLTITPRVYKRIPDKKDDNPKIQNYKGRGDINLDYHMDNGSIFKAVFTNNLKFDKTNKSSLELGYLYPIKNGFYLYLSGFSGYAKSLQSYDKYQNAINLGIAFTR
ncbi:MULTISPECIES: phospholipase A [Campylobacter]|uniref:Phosphatidylcholine 1-acylhydrolase n=1 Tax=Campylobacter porcelli TaxID=1660073 RepID=A0A1X9SUM6_9BACT|nr:MULTISPECIES: phospholipase A [unclassified Campylobacter]MCR8679804.1 phospholipase A [Campylobacter sp. RM19072]MCR8697041.1 phospholipase A [Campylobacter sp. RM19073]MEE3745163.1 phospholipase A [Campylobacter sp. CX2-4855-23]MEE3776679.1 phospholipase A [Campylobacter sp. CX2-4080-23]ARQ99954.1 phospholipase A1 [Campylobacter sp. RM6137]